MRAMSRILGAGWVILSLLALSPYLEATTLKPATPEPVLARTGIRFAVKPGDVMIYLNDKELGRADLVTFTKVEAGQHVVKLKYGKRRKTYRLRVVKKRVYAIEYTFQPK